MFIIKKAQLEAFREPVRRNKRERVFLNLMVQDGNKVHQEKEAITSEDRKGRISKIHYSDKNLLNGITKPSGLQYQFKWDEEDRFNRADFPIEEFLQLDYKKDLPAKIALNDKAFELIYDDKSRISELVYPDKKRYQFGYSDGNQLIAITNRCGETQNYKSAIEEDKLVHYLKDSLGRELVYKMGASGGIEQILFPDGSTHKTGYDEDEDAEIFVLRNGRKRTTRFNGPHSYRMEWEDGNYLEMDANAQQQVEVITNNAGSIQYVYDEKERLVSESFEGSAVTYAYEDECLSNIIYPSGLQVSYTYDEDDRLQSITIDNHTCEYKYAANGTLAQINYPNRLTEHQTSKVLEGLQETKHVNKAGEIVSRQRYQYDSITRLVAQQDYERNSVLKDWKFTYDDECRLTSAKESVSRKSENYEYDGKGNIVKTHEHHVTIGSMDEVQEIGNTVVDYDRQGNVTGFTEYEQRRLRLTYSDDSKMVTATVNGDKWEYAYDGLGRRISKSNGRESFFFFWSGDKLLTEEHKKGNKKIVRAYIYTDSVTPVAFREDDKIYWLEKDARGAVVRVYDDRGHLAWHAVYSAFGTATIITATIRQPWRLMGQYYDEETGLHYNQARYYSPYLRTFLSLDPQWYEYGATNYSYAANDPYNKIDADGNMPGWLSTTLSIGAGIVVGVAVGAAVIALAPALGASLLGLAIVGAIAGGIGAVAESVVSDVTQGKPICWPCALESGLIGAAFGAVLGPLAKVVGNALAPVARKILPKVGKLLSKAGKPIRNLVNKGSVLIKKKKLLKAGETPDKGDLTRSGRALQKHGDRSGSAFPKSSGNAATRNSQGQKVLKDILDSPNKEIKPNRFGGKDVYDTNTGRGARFNDKDEFMGFLEP